MYDFTSEEQFWTKVDFQLPVPWKGGWYCKFTVDYYFYRKSNDILEIYDTFSGDCLSSVSALMENVISKNKIVFLTKKGYKFIEVFLIGFGKDFFQKFLIEVFVGYQKYCVHINNYSLILMEENFISFAHMLM